MKKFAIACSAYEYETDMRGVVVEIHDDEPLYLAFLKAFCQTCNIQLHEACHLVENESWEGLMFRVSAEGDPEPVSWQEVRWPWNRRSDINNRIKALEIAIANASAFESLKDVPGMELCTLVIDLAPARLHIEQLKAELVAIDREWQRYATKPGDGKEQRAIDIKEPASLPT